MQWKKMGCILTAAAMLSVTGCSSKESSSQGSSGSNTAAPVTMAWFSDVSFWNPPTTWSTDPNSVQGAITKNTGVIAQVNVPPQDADTKLDLMMVSGTLPDIISITDPTTIQKLESSGKVWKVDDLLKKYDPDSWILKTYPADEKQAMINRDGAWYAFPSHISSPEDYKLYPASSTYWSDIQSYGNNSTVMFNSKIMAQAGIKIDDLKTESGVLAAFKKVSDMKLKVKGASVIPLLVDGNTYADSKDILAGGSTIIPLWESFGDLPVDKDGHYRSQYLNPINKEVFSFLNTCVRNGYIDPSELTMDNNGVKADVLNGNAFCFIGNSANTNFNLPGEDYWVSAGPMLSKAGTTPVNPVNNKHASTGWMSTFISKSTKYPTQAAKFLSWMSSNEGMMRTWYGVEGKDYTLDSNGLVVQTASGNADATNYAKTGLQAYWPFVNQAWHDHVTPAPDNSTPAGAGQFEENTVQCALGKAPETFNYDNTLLQLPSNFIPTNSDLGLKKAQLQNYVVAQISKIVMAKSDSSFNSLYNDMISKLKSMGIDAVDAKVDEQLQKNYKLYNGTLKDINAK